jgi:hypothetical protein
MKIDLTEEELSTAVDAIEEHIEYLEDNLIGGNDKFEQLKQVLEKLNRYMLNS